jgi:selenocysteine lyase/cysteine desulfurase
LQLQIRGGQKLGDRLGAPMVFQQHLIFSGQSGQIGAGGPVSALIRIVAQTPEGVLQLRFAMVAIVDAIVRWVKADRRSVSTRRSGDPDKAAMPGVGIAVHAESAAAPTGQIGVLRAVYLHRRHDEHDRQQRGFQLEQLILHDLNSGRVLAEREPSAESVRLRKLTGLTRSPQDDRQVLTRYGAGLISRLMKHPISGEEVKFWQGIRKEFYLRDDITYLQGGTVGPSVRPTIERVHELQRFLEEDPLHHRYSGMLVEARERSREKLARFVGTQSERIALVLNTTMAMNIPARGLQIEAGGEILMGDQEYASTRNIWQETARRNGLTVRFVELPMMPRNSDEIVRAFAAGMTPNTRVVLFSHVYFTTGLVTPVAKLTAMAHDNDAVVVVDGAHAPGMVPLELDEWDCDFYGASCHKWLLAAKGVGFAYVAERHAADLEPPLEFQLEIGWQDRIRPYCLGLALYLKQRVLCEFPRARLAVPMDEEMSGFIVSFYLEGVDAEKVCRYLWEERRIEVVYTPAYGHRCFRVSTHFYASFEDLDRFLEALKEASERADMQLDQ